MEQPQRAQARSHHRARDRGRLAACTILSGKSIVMKLATLWLRALIAVAVITVLVVAAFLLRPVSFFNASTYLEERLSGAEDHSIEVHGYRMHYLAEGPVGGQAVILIHGLGGRAEDWRLLAPYLSKAGYRVYLPDL